MEYSKIIAVTGLPGLYELINSKTDGAIVRSLEDKSTRFVSSRIHNFSHLESIEIFTTSDNVNLVTVFQAMESSGASLPDDKDASAVRSYFEKVYPDIDFERVYNSDMKKMIKWYNSLRTNGIEIKLAEPEEELVPEAEPAPEPEPAPPAEAKSKKSPAKKTGSKEKESPKKTEKPAPKKKAETTAKKSEEKDKKSPAKKTASKGTKKK